jgi:hypothetical protein
MFRAHIQRRVCGARRLAAPFVLALGLTACGGGSGSAPTGTVRLSLTDAPTCGYDTVFVTVEKVRLHASASAADADAGWSEVVLDPPQRVDLLTLTDGTLMPLGQTELPAGHYTQMRLVLGTTAPPDAPLGTLPNAITPTGGQEIALKAPSGEESGLKMNIDIDVPADKVSDFAIDFDACRSFVDTGSGQILLKPVLSIKPIAS